MLGYFVFYPIFPIMCLLIAAAFLMPVVRKKSRAIVPVWPCYVGAASWTTFALVDLVGRMQGVTLRVDIIVLGPVVLLLTLVCLIRLIAIAWMKSS
jgi:hypothetical protein